MVQAVVDSLEWLLGPEESGLSTTELVKILDFFFLNTQENLRKENLVNLKHIEQWYRIDDLDSVAALVLCPQF